MLLKRGFRLLKSTQSSLSRDFCCLSISAASLSSSRHIFIFIFHRTPARKFPERLFFPSQHPPESFPKGFPLRVSALQKVSRLRHLKSRDFCYLSISLRPRSPRQTPYLHFHQSPARKSPERLFSPIQHPPESFPTTPPEISRFLLPLDSLRPRGLRQAPYLHFHQSPSRKSPERLSSPSQRTPESFPTLPPEISRFLLPLDISTASRSSPGAISPFSSVARPKVSREAFLSESASSRKFLDYAT